MVSHHSPLASARVYCECGAKGLPIRSANGCHTLAYACPIHGVLHHSALVYERSTMPEDKDKPICHVLYVKDDTGHMIINGVFKEEDEDAAFAKARECYGAFDEVAVARVPMWQP